MLRKGETEVWLMSLRKNLAEVEQDTEEAFENRRELVRLLVEKINVSRDEGGRAKVEVTYRFGPPSSYNSADGVQNSKSLRRLTRGVVICYEDTRR